MFISTADRPVIHSQTWIWFGVGYCSAHFGELLQGAFHTDSGIIRGPVTLPYRKLGVISQLVARLFDFQFSLTNSVPEGVGMGSSTSDIVATLRALDLALGRHTDAQKIAKLAAKTEVACDSNMHANRTVLFAQCEGIIIEDFTAPLPSMTVVGMSLSPGNTFPTAETPPADYREAEIAEFDHLRRELRIALQQNRADRIAEVATQSAIINQSFLPKPCFSEFIQLAKKYSAIGVSVSHSGTVGGVIFSGRGCSPDTVHKIYSDASEYGFSPIDNFFV